MRGSGVERRSIRITKEVYLYPLRNFTFIPFLRKVVFAEGCWLERGESYMEVIKIRIIKFCYRWGEEFLLENTFELGFGQFYFDLRLGSGGI